MSSTGKQAGPPKIAGTHLPLRDFVASVRNPKGQMPPFGSRQVSDKELSDVYAFLHSEDLSLNVVLPSSASPKNGERLYVSFGCYECHGYQGQGSVQTGGSRIGPPRSLIRGSLRTFDNRQVRCHPTHRKQPLMPTLPTSTFSCSRVPKHHHQKQSQC